METKQRTDEARIVDARMRLRERFFERMGSTPSMADDKPLGEGPPNRHGMPRLPQGQYETKKWPVLDLGRQPQVPLETWTLELKGACEHPLTLKWADFMALEQVDDVSDFHCVTTWSKYDIAWKGVRFTELAALADVDEKATHVMTYGYDGYTTNLPLVEALKPDVLLVHAANGAPLPVEHGGPVRMITPQLYAWKGAKWIKGIEFLREDRKGFWEERGYSNTAYPWREDRYG
ncbi:MAG: sulfite oxidase-like oxidoreductase [Myxococcota bacterium]|nr:sulfite oxidase-like oxidoreductase [Myxococcota bacterium]